MTIENIPKKLIYAEIIYNCFIKFCITDLHLPGALNYVSDMILVALVASVLYENAMNVKIDSKPLAISFVLLLLGTVSALMSYSGSLALYVWSLRNTFRLFVFFYCCCEVLTEEDIRKLFDILLCFFYANIVLCVFEYFVRGMEYDFLGGLYGNGIEGGNGPLNALMIIAVTYLIVGYINKEKPLLQLLFGVSGALFIATVGELKIFYFELIVLVFLVCVFITKNLRMLVFFTAAIVIGVVGMSFYIKLYPERAGFLSFAFVKQYSQVESYGVNSNINRLNAISTIWRDYFGGDLKKVLFGLGMGNGEMSSQHAALTSSFYAANGEALRYDWFSHAFIFVEFGIVGLVLYISFFVISGIEAFRDRLNRPLEQTAFICLVFVTMMIFYNQILRIESFCYTAALCASVPVIFRKNALSEEQSNISISYLV